MNEPRGSHRDAASTIFNLSDYRVINVVDLPDGGRRIVVESKSAPGRPVCGVVTEKVHSRRLQRLRDVPVAGAAEVGRVKRHWFCGEAICPRGRFAEVTDQVPRFARPTKRLKNQLVGAVVDSGRAAAEVARAHGVSWWPVQAALSAAADLVLPNVDEVAVVRVGIDEHRYRSVRLCRDETGSWRRFEPWMTTPLDLSTGVVLGVVDRRDSAAVGTWLQQRSTPWRERVEVVAIDPSAAFRRALRTYLPQVAVSVDQFHLVKLANDMLTRVRVRQRLTCTQHGRRGPQERCVLGEPLVAAVRGRHHLRPVRGARRRRGGILHPSSPASVAARYSSSASLPGSSSARR